MMGDFTNTVLQKAVDLFFRFRPQSAVPSNLDNCNIVAHRGEHGKDLPENTILAFERALSFNVWGIEFDLQWTKDSVPVVMHDPDLKRIFGSTSFIKDFTFEELKSEFPLIPSFREVVELFSHRLHLMIEVKESLPVEHEILNWTLRDLIPGWNYHFLSIEPDFLNRLKGFPSCAKIPVAFYNVKELSDLAIRKQWGGICSHYLLMTDDLIEKHHSVGQKVGVGYAASRNSLLREINRKVDWIFSNNAAFVQTQYETILKES